MTASVNAQSLSDITQIASNPPRFPRNPSQFPRKSLTLYIARVPGSRDIILTTLKPLLKNVTAQDVVNSLYYLHVKPERDGELSKEKSVDIVSEADPMILQSKPLKIPSTSPEASSGSVGPDITQIPRRSQSIKRKPVGGSVSTPTQPHRQPLDLRNRSSSTSIARKPLPGAKNNNCGIPAFIPQPDSLFSHSPQTRHDNRKPQIEICEKSKDTFSIAIIRRDPLSGAQWNVGVISGHPVAEKGHGGRHFFHLAKKPEYDISISLTTPGYLSFRHEIPLVKEIKNQSSDSHLQTSQCSSLSFNRKLFMEGCSFWSRASGQRRRAISDLPDRQKSLDCFAPNDRNNQTYDDIKYQEKGYVIISPWGGRCKFLTESGGRSLRCHHTLPSSVSTGPFDAQKRSVTVSELRFNLPSSALTYSLASQGTNVHPEESHESKFSHSWNKKNRSKINAPPLCVRPSSSPIYHRPSINEQPLLDSQSTVFTTLDRRDKCETEMRENNRECFEIYSYSSQEGIDYNSLDLSIGREKAGGGNRGKRAKLGKLVIHDEGLKMLDLIVSANMAIWWSVWES